MVLCVWEMTSWSAILHEVFEKESIEPQSNSWRKNRNRWSQYVTGWTWKHTRIWTDHAQNPPQTPTLVKLAQATVTTILNSISFFSKETSSWFYVYKRFHVYNNSISPFINQHLHVQLSTPKFPATMFWLIYDVFLTFLTHSSAIKITINIKPTLIDTHRHMMRRAIWRWLECVNTVKVGSDYVFWCVGSFSCEPRCRLQSMVATPMQNLHEH